MLGTIFEPVNMYLRWTALQTGEEDSFENTEGSRLMRISLLQFLLLQFFKKIHRFALTAYIFESGPMPTP